MPLRQYAFIVVPFLKVRGESLFNDKLSLKFRIVNSAMVEV